MTHKINHHHKLQPAGDPHGAGKQGAGARVLGQPFLNVGARGAYSHSACWKGREEAGPAALMGSSDKLRVIITPVPALCGA